jgi:alpha-glucosidase
MASDAELATDLLASAIDHRPDWWRQAVVYQVYPRSFADADGDGIGDIPGVTSKVEYLSALGVDAVWLSPFYPSALADGGYDVDDYRDVDPRLGTLGDFDDMLRSLHAAGIRVVVDIVPNHTSNRHAWFQEALAAPAGSPVRDRYIFRDGKGPGGAEPPTDWQSAFGGSAWTRVPDGQWYLHFFAVEQPDLNWQSPEVRADFVRTLRFWADRGVDGFRIDVAHMLTKDLTEPLPSQAELDAHPVDGSHPVRDRDDVHEVYAEWRRVFDDYGRRRGMGGTPPPHAVRPCGWTRTGLQLRSARGRLRCSAVPRHRRRQSGAGGRVGLILDLGALEPRCRPPCDSVRPALRGAGCPRTAPAKARERMAALPRPGAGAGP